MRIIPIQTTSILAMFVCICNGITDREIRRAAERGVTDIQELKATLGVATCCGACEPCAIQILQEEGSVKGAHPRQSN